MMGEVNVIAQILKIRSLWTMGKLSGSLNVDFEKKFQKQLMS